MQPLEFDHNLFLLAMSCLVALVAGFTGLSLTRNLADKTVSQKAFSIGLASVALGGGIWSMHFVAMLGLQLPVLFYYDAAITLMSALTAILIVGAALILLHFVERTWWVIVSAGVLVGIGISVMHYIGMAGLELCRAVYTPTGVIVSLVAAIVLCVLAFWVAYGHRTNRNILLGTLCFAVAVCAVHFLALAGTDFVAEAASSEFGPRMSNEVLALGVILSSFAIFGTFLWVGITYLVPVSVRDPEQVIEPATDKTDVQKTRPTTLKIPCERDGGKVFVSPADVVMLRADGRYTQIYTKDDRLFCVWPITEANSRLLPLGFLQTHRSYLVNPIHVARFERSKDKGRCYFGTPDLPPVPVSRSKLKEIQDALLGRGGAIGAT
jgi:NO-binding membrane sensor protein with MHYT domain